MSSNKVKSFYFAGTQNVANCAWFALRNLLQKNVVTAKGFREFADALAEGVGRYGIEAYFPLEDGRFYQFDDKNNAVDYDFEVVKGQLALLGFGLNDRTRRASIAFHEYAPELEVPHGADEAEVTGGKKFLVMVETKDEPPVVHYAVLLIGGGKKNSKPVRWLDSLRAQPNAYWTYQEFVEKEAPNYSMVKRLYELVEMVRYFPCVCSLLVWEHSEAATYNEVSFASPYAGERKEIPK